MAMASKTIILIAAAWLLFSISSHLFASNTVDEKKANSVRVSRQLSQDQLYWS